MILEALKVFRPLQNRGGRRATDATACDGVQARPRQIFDQKIVLEIFKVTRSFWNLHQSTRNKISNTPSGAKLSPTPSEQPRDMIFSNFHETFRTSLCQLCKSLFFWLGPLLWVWVERNSTEYLNYKIENIVSLSSEGVEQSFTPLGVLEILFLID